jgi:hypothetical protein
VIAKPTELHHERRVTPSGVIAAFRVSGERDVAHSIVRVRRSSGFAAD